MKINRKIIIIIVLIILAVVFVGVLLFLYSGRECIAPSMVSPEPVEEIEERTVNAEIKAVTQWFEAVGTVRPKTETRIGAQLSAQVVDVSVRAGDRVDKDQVLVLLDNRRMTALVSQAQQALKTAVSQKQQASQLLNAARAEFNEAKAEYQRIKDYYDSKAATRQELERVESRFLQAQAGVKRAGNAVEGADAGIGQAEEMVHEARISLGYTQVKAPAGGEVIKRLIEPGDLAMPGKPLVMLKTTELLQLEAFVREGLIRKVKPGRKFYAVITALDQTVQARVDEIISYADPQTRTFMVKATLPQMEGLHPGMYGKLLIPYKTIDVVVIPPEAIRRVGQLEMVRVKTDDAWQMRYIKTGKMHEGLVEVLSGLSGGETLMIGEFINGRK